MKSRRQLMKTMAALGVTVAVGANPATASDTNKINNGILNRSKQMQRSKYLMLPGGSTTTLMANLPVIFDGHIPRTIYFDIYDYKRLQAQAQMYPNDPQTQARAATLDALRRRGNLELVDYKKYYDHGKRERNVNQYWRILQEADDDTLDKAAQKSNQGHIDIRRGTYQNQLRGAIGNLEVNNKRRKKLQRQQRKFERGVGDSEGFNENVFTQYAAALEVRRGLMEKRNIEIDGVLGHGGSQGIAMILDAVDIELDSPAIATDRSGEWLSRVGRPYPSHPAQRHRLIDRLTTVAQETTGIDDEGFYLLGSKFAVPLFDELSAKSRLDVGHDDPAQLADEAQEAIDYLEERRRTNSPSSLEYEANMLSEETGYAPKPLLNRLERLADLTNFSDDLNDLADREKFSQGALLVASAVLADPQYRLSNDEIYREARNLIIKYRDIDVSEDEINFYRNREQTRRGDGKQTDWYHSPNPVRS